MSSHVADGTSALDDRELPACSPTPVLAIVWEPEQPPSQRFQVVHRGRPSIARCRTLSEAQGYVARRSA